MKQTTTYNEVTIQYMDLDMDLIHSMYKFLKGIAIIFIGIIIIWNLLVFEVHAEECDVPTEIGTFAVNDGTGEYIVGTEVIPEIVEESIYRYEASDYEFSIFTQVVEAEVTGSLDGLSYDEAFACKLHVAQVILNRIESNQFPNTMEEVVFQDAAFTPVLDGRYWEVTPTEMTIEACKTALLKETEDTVYGALYFISNSDQCDYGYALFTDAVNHTFFYPYSLTDENYYQ